MNRQIAKSQGCKTYIGAVCKRGHDGVRFTSTANCVRCQYDARNERRRSEPRSDWKERRPGQRARRRALINELKDKPCMDCGGRFHPAAMDFDHREGVDKKFTIAMLGKFVGLDRLHAEIAKCDLVCANCHRVRTFNRRATPIQLQHPNDMGKMR